METLSPNPTTQEVYEHIRAYFSRPDAVLAREGSQCVYRNQNGDKCAVGCCISDELYFAVVLEHEDYSEDENTLGGQIEENDVTSIIEWPQLRDLLNGETEEGKRKLAFLTAAQKAHDRFSKDATDFVRTLDFIAHAFFTDVIAVPWERLRSANS